MSEMIDYRKIISFGKSSFVISLPKGWVNKNSLKKGDLISIKENRQTLTLFAPNEKKDEVTETSTTINIDGKDLHQIEREIIPAYINNSRTITIVGKELREKAKEIQKLLHNLMALEVMEQTADRIVAHDFLNMKEISISEITKKMDIITRAMIADTKKMFKEDMYEHVLNRDQDVNRLSYLNYRAIRYALRNELAAMHHFKLSSMELLNCWMLTHHIEAIADEAKRIARYMKRIELPKKAQQQVVSTMNLIEKNYTDIMEAYYSQSKAVAHDVSARKESIISQLEQLYEENFNTKWIAALTEHMKILTTSIHDTARSVYE